jgi:hypothetical protein
MAAAVVALGLTAMLEVQVAAVADHLKDTLLALQAEMELPLKVLLAEAVAVLMRHKMGLAAAVVGLVELVLMDCLMLAILMLVAQAVLELYQH